MAIAVRGTPTTYSSGGVATTTVTGTVPTARQVDDYLVWHFFGNNITDPSLVSGWTVARSGSGTGLRSVTWYRKCDGSEPSSYSATVTSARWSGCMVAYSGCDPSTILDVAIPTDVAGTTVATQPAITPVTAGALILSLPAVLQNVANTNTLSSSNLDAIDAQTTNTASAGSANPAGAIGREAWTSGAFTPIITASQTLTRSIGRTMALRPAAGFSGVATLSGVGSLTTTEKPSIPVAASLSGGGSLSAAGAVGGGTAFTGTATLSGDGNLTTTQKPGPTPTAALSGSGVLAALGVGYFEFTYEEGTLGNAMSSSPGINGIIGTAAVYVATPFTGHGSLGAKLDSTSNNSWIRYMDFATDVHTGSLYWRPDSLVTTNNQIISFRQPGSGATGTGLIGQIRQGTGASVGKIILFSGASVTAATSTVAFASGDLCRLDWQFYKHGDLYDMTVRIFKSANVEGTVPDDTITATNMGIASAGLAFGSMMLGIFSANPGIYTYDTLRIWAGSLFWPAPYGSTPTGFAGTATLGGDGTLSAGGAPAIPVTAVLSGDGSLTTTQAPRPVQTVALSGDGSLTTTQAPRPVQTVALSGDGTLSTTQAPRPVQTAALSGVGTLAAVGVSAGQAALTGAGILTTVQLPKFVIGGASFSSLVLTGAPDAWWRHGEPSGTVMQDSSGNARNGTYTGSVVLGTAGLVAGDSDTALGLTGANTMYGLATYGSWQNRVTDIGFGQVFDTNVTTLQYMMQRWNTTAPDQLFGIDIGNTSGQVRAYLGMNGGSGNVILSTTGLNVLDGNKHMVFVTWRASDPTLRIYVDGVLAASVACTGTLRSTTDPIYIGRRVGVSTNFFNGILDETIFGPALTDTQIADLWTAVSTGPTGGVQLTGTGSLTTTQAPRPVVSAALSGAGTLSTTGVPGYAGVATLAGSGTLTTTQVVKPVVTVSLTGDGALTTQQVVRVTGTAALSGSGTLAAAGSAVSVSLDHLVTGMGWTDGTTYATGVVTGTTAATSVRLKVADDAGLTTNIRYTSPVTPDAQGYATHSITTISPGGTAYYKVELTPGGALASQVGRAKAAPTKGVAASFSMNFGSCQNTGFPGNTAIWSAIATHLTPDFWMHLGDSGYDNNSSTLQADHRADLIAQHVGRPAMAAAAYQTPSIWQRSDHDSGPSDNGPGGYNTADLAARKQIYPYPPLPNPTDGIYFDTWIGKVHLVMLDTRCIGRSANGATDNSSKTRLGATQKAWLFSKLTEPCDFFVLICEAAWIGDGWSAGTSSSGTTTNNLGVDGWVRFITEQDEIAAQIAAAGLTKKMIYVAGDSHVLGCDTGKNNLHGGFAEAVAAPLDRVSGPDVDGGPYTSGPYWRGTKGSTVTQQFGNLTYDGTTNTVFATGWDVQDLVTPKTSVKIAQGLVQLTGDGTLSTISKPAFPVTAGFSGGGSLSTTQAPGPAVTVALSGAGTLAVVPAVTAIGTATLTGAGSLTTAQAPKPVQTVSLSGLGTLTTVQIPRPTGLATLTGDGTLSTVLVPRPTGAAALSGSGTLFAVGITAGQVAFTGSGTLTTTQLVTVTTVATLNGSGTLTTVQIVRPVGIAVLSGAGVLTTITLPKISTTATLSGIGALTVAVVLGIARSAAFTGTGVLSAVGLPYEQVEFGWVFGLPFR